RLRLEPDGIAQRDEPAEIDIGIGDRGVADLADGVDHAARGAFVVHRRELARADVLDRSVLLDAELEVDLPLRLALRARFVAGAKSRERVTQWTSDELPRGITTR